MPAAARLRDRGGHTPHPAVLIRTLVPGDRRAIGFLLHHLRDESRYLRFHGVNANVHAEVIRLTSADHWHHEALIALSKAPRAPIGVVEYVRLDEFDLAEIAIAVADDWQRRGVGGLRRERAGMRRVISWQGPQARRGFLSVVGSLSRACPHDPQGRRACRRGRRT